MTDAHGVDGGIDSATLAAVQRELVSWFAAHARALPWRGEAVSAWETWVSEVMLQQTRVDTVVPYFTRFVRRFGTPAALAAASEDDVLAHWAGLGYYRRARMLHAGAKAVCERHGGEVPSDLAALRELPGVGPYTAGAIASIAFGLPAPLVDGNVERVLTRLLALAGDPRESPLKTALWSLAARFAAHEDPSTVNQALMELGATVCTPLAPRCDACPLRPLCAAAREDEPARYPEKAPRKAPRDERWTAVVAEHAGSVLLVASAGRWEGMLVPPMTAGHDGRAEDLVDGVEGVTERGVVVHVLTHATLRVRVLSASLRTPPKLGVLVPWDALSTRAVPAFTQKVIAAARSTEGPTPTPARRAAAARPRRAR